VALHKRLERRASFFRPRSAFAPRQIDEGVNALEYRRQFTGGFVQEKHQVVKALPGEADDAQINGDPVSGPQFANEVDVMLQIHGSRLSTEVIGIAEAHCWIEGVARIVKYDDEESNIHMLIAVDPFCARDRLIAGRTKLANLFHINLRRLHVLLFFARPSGKRRDG
jgi:hypothetical protein